MTKSKDKLLFPSEGGKLNNNIPIHAIFEILNQQLEERRKEKLLQERWTCA
jgi:hypothetical protein